MTAPNGGENWQVDSAHDITWTAGTGTGAAIAISRDGGSSWSDIATGLDNSGSYSWTVSGPETTQAEIRVTTSDGADTSDADFTISPPATPPTVTSPNGGEDWQVGSAHDITWTVGTGTGAAIAVSRDGGSSWSDIDTSLADLASYSWRDVVSRLDNTGSYSWTVSGPPTTQAEIRVTTSDGADTSDAVFTITAVSDDIIPPTTTASGYDADWHRKAVTVTFLATDNAGGSGVDYTEYKVDSGSWTHGAAVTILAPAGGGNDGIHTIYYRSVDKADNVEVEQSCEVKIDTVGPVCKAKKATVKKGNTCTLHFAVSDVTSPQVQFTVKVKTLNGVTKKKVTSSWADANYWYWWKFTCTLKKGTYRYYVYAKDLAGNPQSVGASAKLKVT